MHVQGIKRYCTCHLLAQKNYLSNLEFQSSERSVSAIKQAIRNGENVFSLLQISVESWEHDTHKEIWWGMTTGYTVDL